MRPCWFIVFSLIFSLGAPAEEHRTPAGEVAGSTQDWIDEYVGTWVFDIAGLDEDTVREILTTVQSEVDQAALDQGEEDARRVLQTLSSFEATRDYASRLQSFLNRLESREPAANMVLKTPPRLTPDESRKAWLSDMANRPLPARASDYLREIKPIFKNQGIPPQLAWLAEVESSFDPEAKSPVGAVGLFQLMPGTAESLGLSVRFPDERENAQKNTEAAAIYLKYLYNRFHDWPLAMAAYNAGPTRIAKLLQESPEYSYPAIAGRVPLETLSYVAKVDAILQLREGTSLSQLAKPTKTASN